MSKNPLKTPYEEFEERYCNPEHCVKVNDKSGWESRRCPCNLKMWLPDTEESRIRESAMRLLVMCYECKNAVYEEDLDACFCTLLKRQINPTDFCSRGEVR